jgi:tetratricopeptide (TPR) repeat protein
MLAASCCLAQSGSLARAPLARPFRPTDSLNAVAFDHFYNLEYDRAIQDFEQVVQRHPGDPFAINHLITAILIRELYRMGAMNTGEYANDSFIGQAHRPADPKIKERIKDLIQRAGQLEEAALKENSNDVEALYARGVTRGQLAVYTALIERAWFGALRNAVGARRDHEKVLELNPSYTDAKLIVGTHNYVMGSLPWSVKVAGSMVGLSGNKEKGLQYLRDAANAHSESSVDARIVLALFLRREHRYQEALQIIRPLEAEYPRDVLFALEEGNLLRAQEHYADAASVYQRIWQAGREGHYPGLHYELAALSLGDLRRSQKDYSGASIAYELVNQVKDPDPELLQRANLGAGEMYDLLKQRELAVKSYQAVLAVNATSPQAETAKKCIKEPCRE